MLSLWVRPTLSSMVLLILAFISWGTAQDTTASKPSVLTTTALRLAPADCSCFSTSLRLKEQLLKLWNTKSVQQIWKTSLVQTGWNEVLKNYERQAGPMQSMLEQKENKELIQLLLDMSSEECFFLGGPTLPNFLSVVGDVIGAGYTGALGAQFNPGADQTLSRVHAILTALQESIDNFTVPDVVIGFKVPDAKIAQRQVARLAVLLHGAALAVPQLTGNVKNQKINDFNLTTVTLDGAKMPLDMLPWEKIEEDPGEFRTLRDHLKKMKLTFSLGYYEGYVIVGFGESLKFLERLGKNKKLADLDEFKPLLKHLDKQIISVSYSSKEMNSGSGFTQDQADAAVANYMKLLEESNLDDDLRERIEKDIKELGKDMLAIMGHEPGPAVSFSYQTPRGQESFLFQYSIDPRVDYSKSLGIFQHLGGDPILAVLGRSVNNPKQWEMMVKWMKKGESYFREYALPQIEQFVGKDTADQIVKVMEDMYPHLKRLDQTIRTNLYPALADGETAFVIDNKLVSTQWHREMPVSEKPLPLLEPAIVMGVSDRKKLTQAAADIRDIFNDVAKYAHEMNPDQIPRIQWPAPESRNIEDVQLYWYSFPDELKIDGRLQLAAGLTNKLCTFTISKEHSLRLTKAKPLQIDGGPLADQNRKLGGATVFKMAGLVETAEPWVDYFLKRPELKDAQQHAKDIRTILASIKLFHTYSSATYLENNATVTHSEWHLKDQP